MNVRSGRNYSVRRPLVLLIPRTSARPVAYSADPQLHGATEVLFFVRFRGGATHDAQSSPAERHRTRRARHHGTHHDRLCRCRPRGTHRVLLCLLRHRRASRTCSLSPPAQPTKAANRPPGTHCRVTKHSARGSCCAAGGAAPLHGADDPATRHAITCAGKIDRNTESIVGTLVCLLCNRPR